MTTKSKTTKKETNPISKVSEDELTINLQPLLTPISILLTGIMISTSILIAFRDTNFSSKSSDNNNAATATVAPTQADQAYASTQTSIDDDAVLGDKSNAKIAIVEFSDYECPFCQRFDQDAYDQIISEYVDTGKAIFVFRDFPLSFHDPMATDAAIASECVADISGDAKFFEWNKLYFDNTEANGKGLKGTTMRALAKQVGVDESEFDKCVKSEKFAEEVKADLAAGQTDGITGTPGFVIGLLDDNGNVDGVLVPGAQPFEVFQQVIEEQLAR